MRMTRLTRGSRVTRAVATVDVLVLSTSVPFGLVLTWMNLYATHTKGSVVDSNEV